METLEEIQKGRWKAVISRRDDGLLQVSLERWEDTRADGLPMEGAWCPLSTACSKTDTLEIARTLAQALLDDRRP